MKKLRFSDEQIIGMIKEQESGIPTAEVCRKLVDGIWVAGQALDKIDVSPEKCVGKFIFSHCVINLHFSN